MSNTYLDLAEGVLRDRRRPMSPTEILHDAILRNSVPPHLHGDTQEKTLQARLSEDVARLRDRSRFFRTNRARFFLREFMHDPSLPASYREEYYARPRRKDLQRETVLAFEREALIDILHGGIVTRSRLDEIFEGQHYRYLPWKEAMSRKSLLPVYSFVVVHREMEVLTSRVGRYVLGAHLHDTRAVGFGSAVRIQDSDLLYNAYFGIIGSGINELVYSVGLPNDLAREARYESKLRLHCAVLDDQGEGEAHIRIVLGYRCPKTFNPSNAGLSLNRLQWVNALALDATRSQYDHTTEALVMTGWLRQIVRSW